MTHRKTALGVQLLSLVLLTGCAPAPVRGNIRATEARSQKLLAMAATEAAQITDVDQRLTRQLNIADKQIERDWKADARASLDACRATLQSPEAAKLNDHARLSGWVSTSELCRAADDRDHAAIACDNAVIELEKLPDPANRCQYVMGVSNELQYIKGKDAAAAMLQKAGPWTKSIDNVETRRQAVSAFAAALFNLDQYDAGLAMIREEGDAGWRAAVLAQMATPWPSVPGSVASGSVFAGSRQEKYNAASMAPADQSSGSFFFGKDLKYRSVFQNQTHSQTSK